MSRFRRGMTEASASIDVLVIEDDETHQEMYRALLNAEGLSVCVAEDALAAIHVLSARTETLPRIILLDLVMPRMSGREFLQIKQLYLRWAVIPVVVLTGVGRPLPPAMTGAAAIIRKGEDQRHLLAVVRALLAGSNPPTATEE